MDLERFDCLKSVRGDPQAWQKVDEMLVSGEMPPQDSKQPAPEQRTGLVLSGRSIRLPGVEFRKEDAFSLQPEDFNQVDWLCSDVVCYPEKLFDWTLRWVKSGVCKRIICTLKFQGDYDTEIVKRFASVPNSLVTHLFHNKNELTWVWKK